jgi:Raf kinase inhibitor-like YbhB/YbcL family protein
MALSISSTAFEYGVRIPVAHTCEGEDFSPALQWEGEPGETVTFALIVEDPDAPDGIFTHWIIYNLPVSFHILEKSVSVRKNLVNGGIQGKNDFGKTGYSGPCPPRGEEHRYFFRIYALRKKLPPESIRIGKDFHKALNGLILDRAEYMGTYSRTKSSSKTQNQKEFSTKVSKGLH